MPTHDKTAAILTFNNPANYSAKGKRAILAWLKKQEKFFALNSHQMAKVYHARYIYQEED